MQELEHTAEKAVDGAELEEEAEEENEEEIEEDFENVDTPWKCLEGKVRIFSQRVRVGVAVVPHCLLTQPPRQIFQIQAGDINNVWSLSPPYGAVWTWRWHRVEGSPCV